MGAALQLFADLGITYSPPDRQTRRRPMATNCLGVVERMIRKFGLPHATITLRTIVESKGNECALIADIVDAVSDLILANPRWPARGLEFIEAFDAIDLLAIRKAAKATGVQPLRAGIMALVGIQVTQALGPSRPPKPRPVKVKREPKPPRSLTRIPETERGIALGVELLELRATISSNTKFGQVVRSRFDVDQKARQPGHAGCAAVRHAPGNLSRGRLADAHRAVVACYVADGAPGIRGQGDRRPEAHGTAGPPVPRASQERQP
jgi:hypothetical protein